MKRLPVYLLCLLAVLPLDAADSRILTQDLRIRSMEGRYDRFFDAKPMTEAEKDAEIATMRDEMINAQLAKGEEDTDRHREG